MALRILGRLPARRSSRSRILADGTDRARLEARRGRPGFRPKVSNTHDSSAFRTGSKQDRRIRSSLISQKDRQQKREA